VTELYQAHAVGLIKLGVIMLGDAAAAEDVVQDAFFGLYRNWGRLSDPVNALAYARASVLNGCRSALRQRIRRERRDLSVAADAAQPADHPGVYRGTGRRPEYPVRLRPELAGQRAHHR
jgi:DNA-directed RNA polymerase specialized sigma24 family protein